MLLYIYVCIKRIILLLYYICSEVPLGMLYVHIYFLNILPYETLYIRNHFTSKLDELQFRHALSTCIIEMTK